MIFAFSFAWVGFFYLVSLEITFGIWFFYLLCKVEEGVFNLLGIHGTEVMSVYESFQSADLSHQGTGAVIAFALFGFWTARRHLKAVGRSLWRPGGAGDGHEVLPYRVCLPVLAASTLFVAFWLWMSGLPLIVLPVLLGICIVYFVVITRVTTAGGIPTTRPPIVPPYFVISGFGTSVLGERGLVGMGFAMGWLAEMRLFPMIAAANGLKLAEVVSGPKRRLFFAMILAVVCSLVGSIAVLMHLGYSRGGINLLGHFLGNGDHWHSMAPLLELQPAADLRGWVFTGAGALAEACSYGRTSAGCGGPCTLSASPWPSVSSPDRSGFPPSPPGCSRSPSCSTAAPVCSPACGPSFWE